MVVSSLWWSVVWWSVVCGLWTKSARSVETGIEDKGRLYLTADGDVGGGAVTVVGGDAGGAVAAVCGDELLLVVVL